MKLKKLRYGTNYLLMTLLLVAILAVINILSYRHFLRADLTDNRQYTITEATKKVLAGLDDVVNVKVYFSRKLPPYLTSLTDQVKDMLDEYRTYARGNLNIEFIDPAGDPSLEQRMRFLGIPQVRLNVIERDQAQFTNVYLGIAVLYGDNKEVIPAVTDANNFEYDLTSKILQATSSEVKTIGFLSGHGEPDLNKELKSIQGLLQDHYSCRSIDTKKEKSIPANVAALVVASPKQLSEREKYLLDQYIMSGGRVLFFIDTIAMDERRLAATPLASPLLDLVEHYGVKLKNELVLDRSNASASFQSGYYAISVPYPFWVKIIRENFARDNPVVNQLESMVLPWASPIELVKETAAGVRVTELFKSSKDSWVQKEVFDLSPKEEYFPAPADMKERVLGAALSGRFKSFYAGKKVPAADEEQTSPAQQQKQKEPPFKAESAETKLIVVGNSRFITENFPAEFDGNRVFFQNVIDWVTVGDALIGIRSRESTDRPLLVVSDKAKAAIRIINILGVSILAGLFGLGRFYLRRRRKKNGIKEI
jgi:ABC-2 type transport system permease protein